MLSTNTETLVCPICHGLGCATCHDAGIAVPLYGRWWYWNVPFSERAFRALQQRRASGAVLMGGVALVAASGIIALLFAFLQSTLGNTPVNRILIGWFFWSLGADMVLLFLIAHARVARRTILADDGTVPEIAAVQDVQQLPPSERLNVASILDSAALFAVEQGWHSARFHQSDQYLPVFMLAGLVHAAPVRAVFQRLEIDRVALHSRLAAIVAPYSKQQPMDPAGTPALRLALVRAAYRSLQRGAYKADVLDVLLGAATDPTVARFFALFGIGLSDLATVIQWQRTAEDHVHRPIQPHEPLYHHALRLERAVPLYYTYPALRHVTRIATAQPSSLPVGTHAQMLLGIVHERAARDQQPFSVLTGDIVAVLLSSGME